MQKFEQPLYNSRANNNWDWKFEVCRFSQPYIKFSTKYHALFTSRNNILS